LYLDQPSLAEKMLNCQEPNKNLRPSKGYSLFAPQTSLPAILIFFFSTNRRIKLSSSPL